MVEAAASSDITGIDLIFDERMWSRFNHRAEGRHAKVRAVLSRHASGAPATASDVEQIADSSVCGSMQCDPWLQDAGGAA